MSYKFTITNWQSASLTFNELGGAYTIKEIQGLEPPVATINTTKSALVDGGKYNSARAEMRTMNIAFAIEYEAEKHRLRAYQVLQVKKPVTIAYKSERVDAVIEGYVQAVKDTYFEAKQIMTATILCPSPWFRSAQEIIDSFTQITPLFHFPFESEEDPGELIMGEIGQKTSLTVKNGGTVPTGMVVEIYARGTVTNPKIIDYTTNKYFEIGITTQSGDLITIDTRDGYKKADLLRGSTHTNIFNLITEGSSWLALDPGETTFVYTVTSGYTTSLQVTIYHNDLLEGV